jgi:hypothetical protein
LEDDLRENSPLAFRKLVVESLKAGCGGVNVGLGELGGISGIRRNLARCGGRRRKERHLDGKRRKVK